MNSETKTKKKISWVEIEKIILNEEMEDPTSNLIFENEIHEDFACEKHFDEYVETYDYYSGV